MVDDKPRLYSKQPRVAADDVKPEHQAIHADLDRWGRWNRERYQAGHCSSVEHRFDGGSRSREPGRAIVALPPDPRLRAIEEAVVRMNEKLPRRAVESLPQHAETLIQFYCKGWTPKTICWSQALQYEDFATWMYDCRALLLRELA